MKQASNRVKLRDITITMTSDEKIKWVRDRVYELENLGDLGMMVYSLQPVVQEISDGLDDFFSIFSGGNPAATTPPKPKEKVVVITVDEQVDILKHLESQKLIKVLEVQNDKAILEIFPKLPSPLKLRTLEHIARRLADKFTGTEIVDTLLDYGIDRADIPYPNTKWRTLQELFSTLATSPNPELREKLGGAITTFLHPLNFGADEQVSHELIEDFNKYLKYDGYEITAAEDGDGYRLKLTKEKTKVAPTPKTLTEKEEHLDRVRRNTPHTSPPPPPAVMPPTDEEIAQDYSDQVEYETSLLRQPKAAEHLAVMREAYKALVAIVSSFCTDPTSPSRELNTAYTELAKTVVNELGDFCGDFSEFEAFSFDKFKKNNFGVPFTNLYSAELEFKEKGRKLHWDEIRPEMNAVLGQIEDTCDTAGSPDVIADTRVQKIISDAMVHLSEIAASRKSDTPPEKTVKMEITGMPELKVRNVEDESIVKGKKRVYPPKLAATDWAKASIRFLNERDVVITAGAKQVASDFQALGFENRKNGRPNSAWMFLFGLAKNSGATDTLPTPIPDNVKQHKKTISDRLKTLFKNNTDPFEDPTDTRVYRIKLTLIAPEVEGTAPTDALGVQDYLAETMTEKYDPSE